MLSPKVFDWLENLAEKHNNNLLASEEELRIKEVHKETHQAAHILLLLRLLEKREPAAIFAQAVAQRIESERIDAAA